MIGKFIAKVKEIGINKTKGNLPQVVANIVCHYEDENKQPKTFEKVWFGSLKGDASPITLQTLQIMGYKFTVNDLSDIANGQGIDFTKEVEVIIENNSYVDDKGETKTNERIKGIFEVGSAGFQKLNPAEAVTLLTGLDISGTVMNFMQTKGIQKGGAQGTPAPAKEYADQTASGAAKPLPF